MIFNNITNSIFKKLLDGTIAAGNAKKLGGKGASEYALGRDLTAMTSLGAETISTSILAKAETLIDTRDYEYFLSGSAYSGNDLPNQAYVYSKATIKVRYGEKTVILWGLFDGSSVYPTVVNYCQSGKWSGWKTYATTADLANKLDKSGGTVSGTFQVAIPSASIITSYLANAKREVFNRLYEDGSYYLHDNTNSKTIIHSTPDGTNTFNGTATNASYLNAQAGNEINFKGLTGKDSLWINRVNADTGEADATALKGYIFSDKMGGENRIMLRLDQGSGAREILHTGNSNAVKIRSTAPTDTSALWVW